MNINYSRIAKLLLISSAGFMLSGCFSIMLATNSGYKNKLEHWRNDTIIGLSLAQNTEGKKRYVFVGEIFDYLLLEGGDEVVKMLMDPRIDRHTMNVNHPAKFTLNYDKKQFTGELTLKYQIKTEEERQAAISYNFYCSGNDCTKNIYKLKGSIHKKNNKQNYSKELKFYHSFYVAFYKYKTSGISFGAAKALRPVAMTLDIVTSPLQLVGFGIIGGILNSN
ncbi:hypothetical protein QNH14_04625 [Apirhabdus apintestini]|uniref:hypothetical protein n=1 Tax=Erwinia sp. HR93 TaxID=3094840 RepID=UPI002ADEA8A1|nr:hypothetical protein [Erwinia sp. HR93]MEA1064315.1 hypothetical protein [Erwinia sp. HR93]WPM85441.1 hypothetical protein QNH14_04625 [Enterobacteriaceae bacterium CA-0114]